MDDDIQVQVLSQGFVTARKPHDARCGHTVSVGESYWRSAEIVDGEFCTTVLCGYCGRDFPHPDDYMPCEHCKGTGYDESRDDACDNCKGAGSVEKRQIVVAGDDS